ncbi:MAG: beta-galactosidase, partial [Muribaculaceae bacterium]|nr:beta-galactosidase [Muribaculaceae bacterium]
MRTGKGTYVKDLTLTAKDLDGGRYSLLFEGVYERWTLKVNGETVGFRPYGYSSVIYNITPYLHAGKNEIEVEVDNSNQKNSRWFTGSGIYRHVKLIRTGEVAVAPWSLYITTPKVSGREATVDFSFDIDGLTEQMLHPDGKYYPDGGRRPIGKGVEALVKIIAPDGKVVAESARTVRDSKVSSNIKVANPQLWSPETPSLYKLEVCLTDNGKEIDKIEETFGIRSIRYSATDGFRLNGKPIVLNGACAHHDNGMLGAASYDAAEARKVRLLKEAGFNAVRTSHNPPSPAFLDECDRQGLLVIDEAFDGWRDQKTPNDYHLWIDEWGVKDMGDLVKRDRNHPSVIAWSIGNEVIERKHIGVVSTARKLAEECRRLDPTRPVTEALCAWDSDWEIYDPHAEVLDVVGYNYMIHKSETDHERCPDRVMWQT